MDIDFSKETLNYAAEALEQQNFELAAAQANSVIEHDLNNYLAWELRAAAAAGGATVADSRMEEAVNAWMTALHLVPAEDAGALRERIVTAFTALLQSEIQKRTVTFATAPHTDHLNKVLVALRDGLRLQNLLTIQGNLSFDRGNQYTKIARMLSEAANAGFDTAKKAFGPTHSNMLQWQWEKFTDAGDNSLLLLEEAVHYCRDSDLGKNICDQYIYIGETLKASCSWKYDNTAATDDSFVRDQTFTSGALYIRESDIRAFRTIRGYYEADQLNRLCRELAAARTDEDKKRGRIYYWSEHVEEKKRLDKENDDLNQVIARTEQSLSTLPITALLLQTRSEISLYKSELSSLKFTQRKKKNELKLQIADLTDIAMAQQEEEKQSRNALIWEQKKARARIAEIKRIFAAGHGILPAAAGTFSIKNDVAGIRPSITAKTLFEHLHNIMPAPYLVSDLITVKRDGNPPVLLFSSLGTIWEIRLQQAVSDTTVPLSAPHLFVFGKTKNSPLSAVVLQGTAAHTADEAALRDFGRIGSYLLLSLLQEPDQPEAERMLLSLRHSSENSFIQTEGLRMEYLFTEEEQADGAIKKIEYILIRRAPESPVGASDAKS